MKYKTCYRCNKKQPISNFPIDKRMKSGTRNLCKSCSNNEANACMKKLYSLYPEKYKKRNKEYQRKAFKKDPHKFRERNRNWIKKERIIALQKYSGKKPKCACCGENEIKFLTLDHINGNGNKHRKLINNNLVGWLKKHNYPKGFQVLCFNCNQAKGIYGVCPHTNRL